MDITSVFGTAVPGSSPGESTMAQSIGGVEVDTIAARYGTPLYVYDAQTVEACSQELIKAFPDMRVHYAVKANANPALLKLMRRMGLGAEAVSPGELLAATAAGFRKSDISFTAPSLTEAELVFASERA